MHPNSRPLDEAQRQIALLLQQQEDLAPDLYRDLALYLQVLREGLLHAVQQACFHLATQVVPERYGQLPQERRQAFQQRLQTLVQRCTSLLTVEQLMSLAAQQQRREQRRQRLQQQKLLSAFLEGGSDDAASPTAGASASPAGSAPVSTSASDGSVNLSLDLPVSADLFDRGVPGLAAASAGASVPERAPQSPAEDSRAAELQLMQALFQLASDGMQSADAPEVPEVADAAGSDAPADLMADLLAGAAASEPDERVTASVLPRDPLLQLRWWSHFDRALRRRLRNLSHAVNVELLRLGLAQGLLPVSLLDAALEAQVEALPAPVNVLRLPLPAGSNLGPAAPTEVLALLLRCSDLEFDQPRLRTCRKRLEQRRRTLRTMAKRYRSWQRRVSALETEQQWFQDSAPPHPPS